MKKKIITLLVFVAIGFSVYFIYDKMLYCKSACSSSCENKDSVIVTAPIKKDSVSCAKIDSVKCTSTTSTSTKK